MGCYASLSPQTPGHHLPKIPSLPTPSPNQHPQLTNTRGTKEFPRQPISELPRSAWQWTEPSPRGPCSAVTTGTLVRA